jgi:hypothetical protein
MRRLPLKIEICGRGPNRRPPNPDYETWWISTALTAPAPGRIFSLHRFVEPWLPDSEHTMLMFPVAHLPNALLMPRYEYLARYGKVFGSSSAWMMAYAIGLDVDEILVNGCDCLTSGQLAQRESMAYFAGLAWARGIKVASVEGAGVDFEWGEYPDNIVKRRVGSGLS